MQSKFPSVLFILCHSVLAYLVFNTTWPLWQCRWWNPWRKSPGRIPEERFSPSSIRPLCCLDSPGQRMQRQAAQKLKYSMLQKPMKIYLITCRVKCAEPGPVPMDKNTRKEDRRCHLAQPQLRPRCRFERESKFAYLPNTSRGPSCSRRC